MRLHMQNSYPYIHAIAEATGRDPHSMAGWQCLHYQPEQAVEPEFQWTFYHALISALREEYKYTDAELIVCPDGDLFIVGRALDMAGVISLVERILTHHRQPDCPGFSHTVYQLQENAHAFSRLIDSKCWWQEEDSIEDVVPANGNVAAFVEDTGLLEIFEDIRMLRQAEGPLQLLLVEDDPITRRMVAGLFKQDYAVITADSAEQGISNYLLHAPHIVFLDINLPDSDGFRVLDYITAHDEEAYVVMFSGNSYLRNITGALNHGAKGFIPKPFRKEAMEHYIAECRARYQ